MTIVRALESVAVVRQVRATSRAQCPAGTLAGCRRRLRHRARSARLPRAEDRSDADHERGSRCGAAPDGPTATGQSTSIHPRRRRARTRRRLSCLLAGVFLERMHRSGPTESVNGGASSAAPRCPSSSARRTSSETVRGSAMSIIRKENGPRQSLIWSSRSDAMYVMTRRNTSLAGRPATARQRLSRSHSSHMP